MLLDGAVPQREEHLPGLWRADVALSGAVLPPAPGAELPLQPLEAHRDRRERGGAIAACGTRLRCAAPGSTGAAAAAAAGVAGARVTVRGGATIGTAGTAAEAKALARGKARRALCASCSSSRSAGKATAALIGTPSRMRSSCCWPRCGRRNVASASSARGRTASSCTRPASRAPAPAAAASATTATGIAAAATASGAPEGTTVTGRTATAPRPRSPRPRAPRSERPRAGRRPPAVFCRRRWAHSARSALGSRRLHVPCAAPSLDQA
mmetsp:Transcript_42640/g.113981  ORF Transcript_42640/g.113981 Transcript_42640/m.113981 type:complete len:267 (+) Transcript_42640:450-1250(+)